jgi:hypothetical protein
MSAGEAVGIALIICSIVGMALYWREDVDE